MRARLARYEDFLERVEELGFLPLSPLMEGLPSLGGETPTGAWHTGLASDPWLWKDRAAAERRLAYGCILGGHKGFVAGRTYAAFFAAFRPSLPMTARRERGLLSQAAWTLWERIEGDSALNASDARRILGGAGGLESALRQLQKEYYITVDGTERKISAKGEPYGWPVIRYRRVEDWAPAGWLKGSRGPGADEAKGLIIDAAMAMSKGLERAAIAKKLGLE